VMPDKFGGFTLELNKTTPGILVVPLLYVGLTGHKNHFPSRSPSLFFSRSYW